NTCNGTTTTVSPYRTLGFIANSATGEVAVAALSEGNVGAAVMLDLDSRAPGFNFLPVGRLPVAVQTTTDGCRVMVANEGSCDFASVDVGAVGSGADLLQALPGTVARIRPFTSAGPLLAKPHAMELIPAGTTTVACGSVASYHAYVAFPGC